jgi:glycosyltransferase involved in cell wall biosynthesis
MFTGVVLARNEAANIVECLTALKTHVEELILIDMESSDGTVELARPLVDQVLTHPLVPNFDAARNDAIPAAKYDWLWFVDADERVSPQVGQVVRQLVAEQGDKFEAILIPFKSYFCGQWMRYCGWWPGYTMPRVLKRGHFRFSERLHGGVELQGRQIRLPPDPDLGIEHYSYRSIEHYLEKLNRYTSTEAAQLASQGAQWDWREALREMIRDLWMYYEYNPGQLDGERGWILSWLSGQYRWLARAKLIDLPGDPERPPPFDGTAPSNLDEVLDLWKRELSALRVRTPRLPLGIVWRSPLFDPSGYADEGRAFVKALASGDRHLRAEEIRWSHKPCVLDESGAALLKTLTRVERPPHIATITDCIPTLVEPDPSAALNILRTTFETDRLPDGWLERLERFDEVWVIAEQNYRTFRRSGVAPERLRVVPSCYDETLYGPAGPRLDLPPELRGKFVFLSVFDWQVRKGWDVLLKAYCQEFAVGEPVGLLLKITRAHGHTLPLVRGQADKVLAEFGQALVHRPDIVLWDQSLAAAEMAALYRSADAFVLPSRGEGWGRPYMEAMACGLPAIGTRYLGSADFMTEENSFLIDASSVSVTDEAAAEIPPYRGHQWYEPDLIGLRQAMRQVLASSEERQARAKRAAGAMRQSFGLRSGRAAIETALAVAEQRLRPAQLPPPTVGQMHVTLEGEFFAAHSFANINEQLALELAQDERIALSLTRVRNQPTFDATVPHAWRLRPYLGRDIGPPQMTIRHAFPPNWEPVSQGRWVHIQPWEFGHLPTDWLEPLKSRVDECWVPSNYVQNVFVKSGIPAGMVRVIPWGIDPAVFNRQAEPLLLPTRKSFRFLFVGGLIGRKGFDTLLEAYLAEFTPADDVCLVVKDLGSQTFYRYGNFREQLLGALADSSKPSIVYLQQPMTAGQLASLYTACQCLAAPYRAEGFGLPILEAMACGLAPVVPQGGAADDFTSPSTAYLVPSREVETTHDWQLAGPPLELSVSIADVRRAMRLAYEDRDRTRRLGESASKIANEQFTWKRTAALMIDRILELTASLPLPPGDLPPPKPVPVPGRIPTLAACLVANGAGGELGRVLAQVTPFVDEAVVVVADENERHAAIALEYGAKVVLARETNGRDSHELAEAAVSAQWVFSVDLADHLADSEVEQIRSLVLRQPPQVTQLLIDLPKSRLVGGNGHADGKLHIRRRTPLGMSAVGG